MPRYLLAVLVCWCSGVALAQEWKDGFDDAGRWKVITADGVSLTTTSEPGVVGNAVRLDYDFSRGSGYGIIRRELDPPLRLPANHRFTYSIRGEGPPNTLEFKLLDVSRDNVWWVNQRAMEFPAAWTAASLPRRRFSFAWGPSGGKPIDEVGAIEIAITSVNGGKGTVWLDELALETLPEVRPYTGTPSITVSSRADGGDAPLAINAENFVGWRSGPRAADPSPSAMIDFGAAREFGGLVLEWDEGAFARDYRVEVSADGQSWTEAAAVTGGNGGRDYLSIPDATARLVRVRCAAVGGEDGVGLRTIRVMPLEFGESANARLGVVAKDARRGMYPKHMLGEKSYWTVVGLPGEDGEALINEEGAVEIDKLSPTLEPFILMGGKLVTWADTANTQTLVDGYLPIPTVTRTLLYSGSPALELGITAHFAEGEGGGRRSIKYALRNPGARPREGTLHIALRPFQVNPPEQDLNITGGAAKVREIRGGPDGCAADEWSISAGTPAASFGAAAFGRGEIVEHLAAGKVPPSQAVTDPEGMASAAFSYPFALGPGEDLELWFHITRRTGEGAAPSGDRADEPGPFTHTRPSLEDEQDRWKDRLDAVHIRLPHEGQQWWDTVRSNLAYILINADGPAIQPGSRSYERTWIRDGSLTSAALLAFGFEAEVRAFLDWFAPFQYDNGKVPCCVDRRGPDPVPEHDSHGQYIWAVAEYYRFTRDAEFLRHHWPRVVRAVEYIELLRETRMTGEYAPGGAGDKRVFFGLMPESISHEGYSAKAMHSYWDDFFTAKGLADAAFIAGELGEGDQAARLATLRDSFGATLLDSLALAMRTHGIDYLPGCAELGDFDATSTTVALWPCGQMGILPRPAIDATFDRYMAYFRERRDGLGEGGRSEAYTPYEWRIPGSLVRLGRRDEAMEVGRFLMDDRRPRGWNHWAEVVWKDPAAPRFIGDMPHTWVGSDFINSFRAMLAHVRDGEGGDGAVVLAAGLPPEWFRSADGLEVRGLRTRRGPVSYSVSTEGKLTTVLIASGPDLAAGGLVLRPPGGAEGLIARARVDGADAPPGLGTPAEIRVGRLPATVVLEYR